MITPQEFAAKYVDLPLDDYVCLVHDPRPTSPIGRTFTVEYLGNVLGAPPVTYLNVDMSLMKKIAAQTIEGGEPVWFGCDVGQMMSSEYGIWDKNLFDLDGVYDTKFTLDKADRLIYGESLMTHAMLFTGVDVADGATRKWRVENSWGTDRGKEGFYTMNDSWFDEYVFEIAARKETPARRAAGGPGNRADRAARLGPHGRAGQVRTARTRLAVAAAGRHAGHRRPGGRSRSRFRERFGRQGADLATGDQLLPDRRRPLSRSPATPPGTRASATT